MKNNWKIYGDRDSTKKLHSFDFHCGPLGKMIYRKIKKYIQRGNIGSIERNFKYLNVGKKKYTYPDYALTLKFSL